MIIVYVHLISSNYDYSILLFVRQLLWFHSSHYAVGPPCQAPITYSRYGSKYRLLKSDNYGVCYDPNPIYYEPTPRPYVQKLENAKATNSVSLCEEGEGCKEIPNVTGSYKTNLILFLCTKCITIAVPPGFFWGGGGGIGKSKYNIVQDWI